MKPFEQADVPDRELEVIAADLIQKWLAGNPEVRLCFPDATRETISPLVWNYLDEQRSRDVVWLNDLYQVSVRRQEGGLTVLSIKRIDREPIMDWRHLQEIKNQLLGPECEAVQLFPAESRLVDTSNQYWLWGISDPKYRFPFGFDGQRVVSEQTIGKSKQRPFEKENV